MAKDSKMENPYEGTEDQGEVTISRGLGWAIAVAFLLVCIIPPIGRHLHEATRELENKEDTRWFPVKEIFNHPSKLGKELVEAKRKGDPSIPEGTEPNIRDHLVSFEKKLEKAAFTDPPRRWFQSAVTPVFKEGNRKTRIGKDGWLFFQPAIDGLTGYGPIKPEPDTVAKDPNRPPFQGPLEVILDFAEQLEERDIDLLLVPLPVKPMIRPEAIAGGEFAGPTRHADQEALYDKLREGGVEILDLADGFWARKAEEDVFMRQDTHWTPATMKWAASEVAKSIRAKGIVLPNDLKAELRPSKRSHLGDLVGNLDFGEGKGGSFSPEEEELEIVIDSLTGAPVAIDRDAPIVVLGDSFVNIFDDPKIGFSAEGEETIGGGFAQHLAAALGSKVDLHAVNGEAATTVRIDLAKRGKEVLQRKKLIVWTMASRDLIFSESPAEAAGVKWKFLPVEIEMGPAPKEMDATLTILDRATIPDPKSTPYEDALYGLTAKVESNALGEEWQGEIQIYAWAFEKRKLSPTSALQKGSRYRMKLVDWDGQAGLQRTKRQELEDLNYFPTFFIESFEKLEGE